MNKYIDEIISNGNNQQMEDLRNIFNDLLEIVKKENETEYKTICNRIKGIATNYQINEELAKDIVHEMKPYGEYWSIETIKSVVGNDTHKIEDMYLVMNSLVNDYSEDISPEQTDLYIKLAHSWIDDVDAKEHKMWKYFVD